ncbi:hypothetical protein Syun_020680 [Stephania yunnanensis]|uniref:Uncharacterized protein n=1 Tax=Stephania yunnanensis TaxID=152371 RepID=A0AAP0IF24_9MAGN
MSNRGRGGRRPPTTSYRKEKEQEKVDLKGNGKIGRGRAKKVELHDECSNINMQRHSDLVVARGEDEAQASESSSSDSSALADTTSSDHNVGGSTSGGGAHMRECHMGRGKCVLLSPVVPKMDRC